ncbi:LysM peptidoglycan-binding domain-containing protein [Neobacillus ginsengisoli]|uniref:LysM domain-containing protein n=1 Tax=Neobacillus ginsengisoli TaxID=904295 RepID=A0ABT9XYB6_9BACI|nr:LysM domain-containing protein [Neobacillus ginsengisoli]MDQ0200543.1 hypothetical protein [Neobacillus ginsengisoli]
MITYILQPGDNLLTLAQMYHTTVEEIVAANPSIGPYNLFVGQIISIPAARQHKPIAPHHPGHSTHHTKCGPGCVSKAELDLNSFMRVLWEEHIAWTRMVIISITFKLPDVDFVIKRLLQNATNMGAAFKKYYGEQIGAKFAALIKDHLVIAAQLVKAAAAGDSKGADMEEKRWYANAAEIADFLNKINPANWPKDAVNEMMKHHLRLTKSEAVYMITKDYASDVAIYDEIEKQALEMADAFTNGIIKQFPHLF